MTTDQLISNRSLHIAPALRGHWRLLGSVVIAVTAGVGAVTLIMKPQYQAAVSLATISNQNNAMLAGGLSTLLGANMTGGLQITPALIAALAHQEGVLYRVAHHTTVGLNGQIIATRLADVEHRRILDRDVTKVLREMTSATVDKQTGIVTLQTTIRDSALARIITNELVNEISSTFINASRAQASQVRVAMDTRMDSAASQLRHAENEMRAFLYGNRVTAPYSEAAIERQRLERKIDIAQTVYSQVVNDRESAIAKELGETPAVLVLDPVPHEVPRLSRYLLLKMLISAIVSVMLVGGWLVVRYNSRITLLS
jgi:uncharacterized protein involved in exopolysaccharide biosynthesis